MRKSILVSLVFLLVNGFGAVPAQAQAQLPGKSAATAPMKSFRSDRELKAFLNARLAEQRRVATKAANSPNNGLYPPPPSPNAPPPLPPPPPPPPPAPSVASPTVAASEAALDQGSIVVSATKAKDGAASPNITNRQEADVDEGGIVKVHGDHLVVLRRGRLFTVSVADKAMKPIAMIDAFPPGASGQGAWYDEMLISGDRVIVVGYSYARGGTEISRFAIGRNGALTYEDTHHLRSDDYYSSRNYASRMIGSKLIFYTPLSFYEDEYLARMPGVRKWSSNHEGRFLRTAPATNIYIAEPIRRRLDSDISSLHTVTVCDLAAKDLSCSSTSVLGGYARSFYVSGKAVYVWAGDAIPTPNGRSRSIVYRLPLDGSRPGAIQTRGQPIDQFSFREDRAEGMLNVLVRAEGYGDWMWGPEVSEGDVALARIPVSLFGNGAQVAGRHRYRKLPRVKGWNFQNRFVGRHVLYGAVGGGPREDGLVHVVPLGGGAVTAIKTPHGAERIEQMGQDAVIVGSSPRSELGFSAIELGATPRLSDTYLLAAASQGETRSHAYFYRSDSADGADGLLGLPIARALSPGMPRFLGSGAAITFLGRKERRFAPAGELEAKAAGARDDACQASCVDWYGNARPIFLGDRVFALMGYELVEGRVNDGRISETGRADFAPGFVRD